MLRKLIASGLFLVFFAVVSAETEEFIQLFLPDGTPITAELAVTDYERQRGLMYRKSIEEDQGMLFVFAGESFHSFWMKNMNFSIDILWLDEEKRIVHIEERVPPCSSWDCPSYAPDLPAQYVLELQAGMVERHCIQKQQRVDFVLN